MSRTVTGALVGLVFIALWILRGVVLRIALVLMMALAIWETFNAFTHRGARPARWAGMLFAALAMPAYLQFGADIFAVLVAAACILGLVTVLLRGVADFESFAATLLPMFYPGLMFLFIFPMQDFAEPMHATLALGLTFLISMGSDTMAYEVGTRWGKHKLAPTLSPKKTIEGAIGGLGGAVLVAVLVPCVAQWLCANFAYFQSYALALPPLWQFVLLGLVGGIASQCGDLTASMIKRYCGIKDFGTLLPGHGGILDRLDSILFNAAVVYAFFTLVVI